MLSPRTRPLLAGVVGLALGAVTLATRVRASDHADTPEIFDNPGTDISDVFVFPSPENAGNVVLVMNVRPLIPAGQGGSFSFDTDVLYQFKIDTNADVVEDLVIQATFQGTGSGQRVRIHGPAAPRMTGTRTQLVAASPVRGELNQTFAPRAGMKAFAGVREDPFFFDLDRFYAIFPDRKTPLTKQEVQNPNAPQLVSWRGPGEAVDFLANFNVLSIVLELPRSDLGGGRIGVWTTTSR